MSKPIYTSAAEAEAAFYDALARSDLEAMMTVWSEDEDVVCIHPGGPRIVGLAGVRETWRQMFAGGARLVIRITQQVVCANMMQTVHNVFEHIAAEDDDQLGPPIVATNVYARGATGWRMVMHHASPTPDMAELASHGTPRVVH
ncbi:DUF4440 domain-containing protein [Azoarcus sp. DD4]|uniref:YybH family protein n=1 Tax=Azoarcus sp. DD4 TaxID=2027405 RepID=UPI0011280BF6|nr:nuclear transport factor 2 family protein [Azoarcus sp. DD4]QDF98202.1 DUF4440 domain-containing protein [Azoarcus sp. DD4]